MLGDDKSIKDARDAHEHLTNRDGEVEEGSDGVLLGLSREQVVVVVKEAGDKVVHGVGINKGGHASLGPTSINNRSLRWF